ncbi:MAG: DMT family transporter [Oscillospiraceae bacterium]
MQNAEVYGVRHHGRVPLGPDGLFTRTLATYGVDPRARSYCAAALRRCCSPSHCSCATQQFRIRLKDIWCFSGTGICSLLFFTYCYFQAITLMDLSTAAVLLYTAPSIVMILSLVLFHERITVQKLIALVLAFAGCCLVSLVGGEHKLSTIGILYGLGAGFGYALYSIFARYALDRGYSSNTINFYSCLLTTIGAVIIWGAAQPLGVMFGSWKGFGLCTALGIVTCYLPYLLYTFGLTGLETGKASILASFEPVVATLVGIFVFHEKLTPLSALGCVCVLSAVVLLNLKRRQKAN